MEYSAEMLAIWAIFGCWGQLFLGTFRIYSINMKVIWAIGLLILSIEANAQTEDFPDFQKYSFENIYGRHPFNLVKKIILVSYGIDSSKGNKDNRGDEPKRIPMKGDQIVLDDMDAVVTIPTSKIDTVADILYNTCYRWKMTEYAPAMCFLPRNAIIFVDANDKTFCVIEVCFECGRLQPMEKQLLTEEDICDNTFDRLESFFITNGLRTRIRASKK